MDDSAKSLIGVNLRMMEEKPSGIQNYISGLFKELIKSADLEFLFFSTGNKKIQEDLQHFKANSLIMNFLKKIDPRLANIFFDNFYILRFIKDFKVKIFLSPSFILPFFKPKGVKYITVIHDLSFLSYKHNPFRLYMNLVMYMKVLMPRVLKRADLIIVPSVFVKEELLRIYGVYEGRIQVIYEGREPFFYQIKDKKEFLKIQKKYKIKDRYLFTTATNHERKNLSGLINAFKALKERRNLQLVICGLLPAFAIKNLKKQIKDLHLEKEIIFLGFVSKEELRILYSFAKFFIFPSFEEGFGLPILEAVGCGCLPICSRAGALPEIIGRQDLTFDPKDQQSMSRKIGEILALGKDEIKSRLDWVDKHTRRFSWEKAAEEYRQLIKNLHA